MKLIVGIIRPERLEAVQRELAEAKVFRLTLSDVQGVALGAAAGQGAGGSLAADAYAAGGSSEVASQPAVTRKVRLEIAVNEEFVEPTVRAIARAARLDGGSAGDGKVLVLPLDEAVRIRTGERGPEAI